jgi:hypothetical protein
MPPASGNLTFLRLHDSAAANYWTIILVIQATHNKIVLTRFRILRGEIQGFGKGLAVVIIAMNKVKYIAAVLIAIACFSLQRADAIQYTLSTGNPALTNAGFTGPYATVTVTLVNSTTATVTFNSLTQTIGGNTYVYLMGDGSSGAVNVKAGSWTISGMSGSNSYSGFNSPALSNAGSQNVDGFGVMNQTVDNFDGFSYAMTTLSFTLTNMSGSWANAGAVLIGNLNGALAAAHIFVAQLINGQLVNINVTGYAANGGSQVPDGGTTVMLLGAALGALGMARRLLMS